MHICVCVASVVPDSLRPRGPQPARLLCPGNPPGQDTGVGCHALLQGIFPTQGLNPGLPHCRQILYFLSYPGSPVEGQISFQIRAFVFFRKVRRSGTARLHGRSSCDVLRNLHTGFHGGCANSHPYQQCTALTFSSRPRQFSLYVVFLMTGILADVR